MYTFFPVSIEENVWSTDVDVVESCGKGPKNVIVLIDPIAREKIDLLMEKYKYKEWLAYLIGEKDNLTIKDIVIPKQETTGASVDKVVFEDYNKINVIGVIHSHHSMGSTFSGVDNEWINQNHNISIIVSHNDIKCRVRYKVPCGALFITEGKMKLNISTNFDKELFLKDANEKIKEPTYTNNHTHNYTSYGYGGSWPKPAIISSVKEDADDLSLENQLKSLEDDYTKILNSVSDLTIVDDIVDSENDSIGEEDIDEYLKECGYESMVIGG